MLRLPVQDTGSPSELYVSVITIASTVCNSNSVKQLLKNIKQLKIKGDRMPGGY